ncbi:hypothetical protein KGF56_000876 [Candida oxycetoniae]|uniref:RRM domain-containing protein n=1 Tax=Candida oxycetoniae TaxID=497107 RepID=A0AAI9T0X5_9ASCO|nr:uncharacterized protein KGF56_000876 [Candida oxycetoniae]KAI3406395.1 hypothetical protein KGF56_000876 [Candida oxycetoniae]
MPPSSNTSKVRKPQSNTFDGKHISAKKAASYLHSVKEQNNLLSNVTRIVSPTQTNSPTTITTTTVTRDEPNWNKKHFRLFVGNLGPDATDELLRNAFQKYTTLSNVHVPIDSKSKKPRGFGFVAFASANDYLQAFKDMNGKYIGQYPVQLKRAESNVPKKQKKMKQ